MTEPTIHSVPLSKLYVLEPCMFDNTVKRVWVHRTFEQTNSDLFRENSVKDSYHEQGCLKGLFYFQEDEDRIINFLRQSGLEEVVDPTWEELLVIYHEQTDQL